MLHEEFTKRTGVDVTPEEFAAVHDMYMQNDMSKDEFCKLWCKMNEKRVKAAKESAKEREERAKIEKRAFNILCKYEAKYETFLARFELFCLECMNERELNTLQSIGINTDRARLNEAFYDIKKYLNIIKD